jgi:hypothetical protein
MDTKYIDANYTARGNERGKRTILSIPIILTPITLMPIAQLVTVKE